MDRRDKVWDYLNQTLTISKMVLVILNSFNSFVLMKLCFKRHAQFIGLCVLSDFVFKTLVGLRVKM